MTCGVVQVSDQGVDRMLPSVRADLVVDDGRTAQLQACGSPGILGRKSVGHSRIGRLLQVVLYLVVGISISGLSLDEHA